MLRHLFTVITICILVLTLLGCQSVPNAVNETSTPNNNTPVTAEACANSETNNIQDSPQNSSPQLTNLKKISVTEMEATAFEASEKAKNTVPGWANAEFRHIDTRSIKSEVMPTDVFSLDDYNKKLEPEVDEMYTFLFQDISVTSSFLYLYIDANTGNLIGCYYTPEIMIDGYSSSEAKITVIEAERIALEAAQKAKNTVSGWENADINLRDTTLTSDRPNYVYPVDRYPTGPVTRESLEGEHKQLDLKKGLKYRVWYNDGNELGNVLLIYIDAVTGDVMGCKVMSE